MKLHSGVTPGCIGGSRVCGGARAIALLLLLCLAGVCAADGDFCAEKVAKYAAAAQVAGGTYTDPCSERNGTRELAEKQGNKELLEKIPVCKSGELWRRFSDGLLAVLEADPANRAALRAAATLRRYKIPFAGQDARLLGDDFTGASYFITEGVIYLDYKVLEDVWMANYPDFPDDVTLRRAADKLSPWIVHELAHARLHKQLGKAVWEAYPEDDIYAYAEQASYLIYRLRRQPDAFGLRCVDGYFAKRLGAPLPGGVWWLTPIEPAFVERARPLAPDARYTCGTNVNGTNSWYLLRSFSSGFSGLERNLRALPGFGMEGTSLYALPPDHLRLSLESLAARKAQVEACRPLAEKKGLARLLDENVSVLDAKAAFYSSKTGLDDLQRRQRAVRRELVKDMKELGVKP